MSPVLVDRLVDDEDGGGCAAMAGRALEERAVNPPDDQLEGYQVRWGYKVEVISFCIYTIVECR